jgi:UDP-glucose 4-epimerase
MKDIIITGGAGFIGSHIVIELLQLNIYNIHIIDNLSNSSINTINKLRNYNKQNIIFHKVDICKYNHLKEIFNKYNIYCVIHLAGLKSVSESIKYPYKYYNNNVCGTLNLINVMKESGCNNLIFSSSSTVYGNSIVPYTEKSITGHGITNPYGNTKYMIEQILKDEFNSNKLMNIIILRYFNPMGAHSSGLIGENIDNNPQNLMPNLINTLLGKKDLFYVYGSSYKTKDGSAIRDFIHVVDLANAHIKSLEKIEKNTKQTIDIYNIGTGNGFSVLDVINMMIKVSKKKIKIINTKERDGDLPISISDCSKARNELNWESKKKLKDICEDTWNYYK